MIITNSYQCAQPLGASSKLFETYPLAGGGMLFRKKHPDFAFFRRECVQNHSKKRNRATQP
jgi:hypothetical protein